MLVLSMEVERRTGSGTNGLRAEANARSARYSDGPQKVQNNARRQ